MPLIRFLRAERKPMPSEMALRGADGGIATAARGEPGR